MSSVILIESTNNRKYVNLLQFSMLQLIRKLSTDWIPVMISRCLLIHFSILFIQKRFVQKLSWLNIGHLRTPNCPAETQGVAAGQILAIHRGPEQDGGLTNWTKRSDTIRVAGATPLTTPHVQTNHGIPVFWENQFFGFWGALKNFYDPSKPYLALETTLLGGHTSKTFWSELRFWSYKWQNSYFLA